MTANTMKLFGTDGIRGPYGQGIMTPEGIMKLGWAAGAVLAQPKQGPVLIGKDTRASGTVFEAALEAGLVAAGIDVIQLGVIPTPGVAYLTAELEAQAGIMISASHNPHYDNGIKFFSHQGHKIADEAALAIEAAMAETPTWHTLQQVGSATRQPALVAQYAAFCLATCSTLVDLSAYKIVVDCAHGATYEIAPAIFKKLGATVVTIGTEPNGTNINAQVGSTAPAALAAAVIAEKADLGIAFDGDGDRLILVDQTGQCVDGDQILYVLACAYQDQSRLSGGVVGTQMSNMGLELALAERNIPFKRALVGDRFVLAMMQAAGWNLGGEGSGHLICLDKVSTGDGLVAALSVLAQMVAEQQPLHLLTRPMQKCEQVLLNVPCQSGQQVVAAAAVQQAVSQAEASLAGKGRVLLRASGTEPVVRVMVEGDDTQTIQTVASKIADEVRKSQIA